MNSEIWVAIITAISAVAVAIVSGIFSSRAYLRKQLASAQSEVERRHRQNHDRAVAIRRLISCICRVLFWMKFALVKSDMVQNGELEQLEEAMEAMEESESSLKEIERSIAIQE